MQHRLLTTIISIAAYITVGAQGTCIINGNIADCKLSNGKKIKKVYLTRKNELGQTIEVAQAKVKKGKYIFNYNLAQDEPAMQYTITGFGEEKGIKLFVEPGEVTIDTQSASNATHSTVTGTETNNLYNEYKAIATNGNNATAKEIATLRERNGNEWIESKEGEEAVKRAIAHQKIKTEAEQLKFLIDHNASPMTALEVEQALLPKLSSAYAEQILKAMSTLLQNHPYYHSLRNKVLSNCMKVGSEAPNISLPLNNGNKTHLADYRGKHVVLNFWKKDCSKSAEMMTELHKLHELIKDKQEQFVIISFALENNTAAWKEAIQSNGADKEGWLHACDGADNNSPAAKLYKVEETPKTLLIEPEGRVASLNLEVDEIVMRAEQVLAGDLYYLDNQEE